MGGGPIIHLIRNCVFTKRKSGKDERPFGFFSLFRGSIIVALKASHNDGRISLLLFVNDLPDALEALTLLFTHDVKMVTLRTQNLNLHSSLIAVWDWSHRSILLSANTSPLGENSPWDCPFPRWDWHTPHCTQISKESRDLDRQCLFPLLSAMKLQIRQGDRSSW